MIKYKHERTNCLPFLEVEAMYGWDKFAVSMIVRTVRLAQAIWIGSLIVAAVAVLAIVTGVAYLLLH